MTDGRDMNSNGPTGGPTAPQPSPYLVKPWKCKTINPCHNYNYGGAS